MVVALEYDLENVEYEKLVLDAEEGETVQQQLNTLRVDTQPLLLVSLVDRGERRGGLVGEEGGERRGWCTKEVMRSRQMRREAIASRCSGMTATTCDLGVRGGNGGTRVKDEEGCGMERDGGGIRVRRKGRGGEGRDFIRVESWARCRKR